MDEDDGLLNANTMLSNKKSSNHPREETALSPNTHIAQVKRTPSSASASTKPSMVSSIVNTINSMACASSNTLHHTSPVVTTTGLTAQSPRPNRLDTKKNNNGGSNGHYRTSSTSSLSTSSSLSPSSFVVASSSLLATTTHQAASGINGDHHNIATMHAKISNVKAAAANGVSAQLMENSIQSYTMDDASVFINDEDMQAGSSTAHQHNNHQHNGHVLRSNRSSISTSTTNNFDDYYDEPESSGHCRSSSSSGNGSNGNICNLSKLKIKQEETEFNLLMNRCQTWIEVDYIEIND
jgi:hypothetical protein